MKVVPVYGGIIFVIIAGLCFEAAWSQEKVDINHATQAELESLPGIGPTKARRIIEYRQEKGGFQRIEELDEVYGIGPKTVSALKPLVTLRGGGRSSVTAPVRRTVPTDKTQMVKVRCWKCGHIFEAPAGVSQGQCPVCSAKFSFAR